MKKFNKVISKALILIMVLTAIPIQVYAEDTGEIQTFSINYDFSNVIPSGVRSFVDEGDNLNITLEAVKDCEFPNEVTVEGVYEELNYDKELGILEIVNIQSDLFVKVHGVYVGEGTWDFTIDYDLSNVYTRGDWLSVNEGDSLNIRIDPMKSCILPNEVTVEGVYEELNYDKELGILEIVNIQSDLFVKVHGVYVGDDTGDTEYIWDFTVTYDFSNLSNVIDAWSSVDEGDSLNLILEPMEDCILPDDVTVEGLYEEIFYDKELGTLDIINIQSDLIVKVHANYVEGLEEEEEPDLDTFPIIYDTSYVDVIDTPYYVTEGDNLYLSIEAQVGYKLPDEVDVEGNFDSFSYSKEIGKIDIINVQSEVYITIHGERDEGSEIGGDEGSEIGGDEEVVLVNTEIEPTIIAFSIPNIASLVINPNAETEEERVLTSDIKIVNNSTAPITILIHDVKQGINSEHTFTNVGSDAFEDWSKLGKVDTENYIAISVNVKNAEEWRYVNNTNTLISYIEYMRENYGEDVSMPIGSLAPFQSAELYLDAEHGLAVDRILKSEYVITYKVILSDN